MSEAAKDLVIENLRNQIEQYKQKLASFNFEALSTKISSLEKIIVTKDQEIMDLRAMAGGDGTDTELRTKNIVLQGKVRSLEAKITELTAEKDALQERVKRLEKEANDSQQIEVLRKQLRQEMEKSERYQAQLSALTKQIAQVDQIQQENQQLKQQLKDQSANPQNVPISAHSGPATPAEIQKLRTEIIAKDKKIAQLEAAAQSNAAGTGSGPMAVLRLQREIAALKAQIQAMKKNETGLQQQLMELNRKSHGGWDQEE